MTQERNERFNTHAPPPSGDNVPGEEDIDPAKVDEQLESDPREVPNATDPASPVDAEDVTDSRPRGNP